VEGNPVLQGALLTALETARQEIFTTTTEPIESAGQSEEPAQFTGVRAEPATYQGV
jgi:hypothetical protein